MHKVYLMIVYCNISMHMRPFCKTFFGFGLDKYAYINQDIVPSNLSSYIISAHNAYLAIIVQYGIIFGLIFLELFFIRY